MFYKVWMRMQKIKTEILKQYFETKKKNNVY